MRAASMILAMFLAVSVAVSQKSPTGPNLVENGGMEKDADGDGRPDGWRTSKDVEYKTPENLAGVPWKIERSPVSHSGRWSLHYVAAEIKKPALAREDWWDFAAWEKERSSLPRTWAIPVISNRFPVSGEREYLFRMWIKAKGARSLHVKYIGHYKGHPDSKTYWTQPLLRSADGLTHVNGSWDWKLFETRLFTPGGQNWGRLEVWLLQDGQPCEIWVDDVEARVLPAQKDQAETETEKERGRR